MKGKKNRIVFLLILVSNLIFGAEDRFSTLIFKNNSDQEISVYIFVDEGKFKNDVFDGKIKSHSTSTIRINKPKRGEIFDIFYVITLGHDELCKRSKYVEDTIVLDYDSFSLYHIRQDNELKNNVVQEMLDINLYNDKSLKFQDSIERMKDLSYGKKAITFQDSITLPLKKMLLKKPQNYYSLKSLNGLCYTQPVDSLVKYFDILDSNLFGQYAIYQELKKQIFEKVNHYEIGNTLKSHEMYDVKYHKTTLPIDDSAETVLAFWFIACVSCYHDFDSLYLYAQHHPFPKVLAVGTDNDYKRWIEGIEKHKIKWDNYSDLKGIFSNLYKRFKIERMPLYVYIGKNRRILKIAKTSQELIAFYNFNR